MDEKVYDIIIIGGGCAGLTAAVYARRASKTVLLIENQGFGGQISYSPNVENFPGFLSVSGIEFSDKLYQQAENLGTETELENVISITVNDNIKTVTTDYGTHKSKAVIISTGLKHRKSGIENEENFIGKGVSYCAVCDGAFFKNKDVAVLGGGNTAVQDAVFLSDLCNKVYIIHRRDEFRADIHLVNKMKARKNIELVLNSTLSSINGKEMLSSVTVKNKSEETKELPVSGLFVAIGQIPQNSICEGLINLDDYGFINSSEDCKTNIAGIFAAGDCRTKKIRQLVTAASDGAIAATNACKYIDSL